MPLARNYVSPSIWPWAMRIFLQSSMVSVISIVCGVWVGDLFGDNPYCRSARKMFAPQPSID